MSKRRSERRQYGPKKPLEIIIQQKLDTGGYDKLSPELIETIAKHFQSTNRPNGAEEQGNEDQDQ